MAIEIREERGGKIITVQVTGTLTIDDYDRFVPALERAMKQQGKIRLLMQMHSFHGWTVGALWQDTKFAAKHFRDLERLALVGEKVWQQGMATFCKPFTTAKVRYFDHSELAAARAWMEESDNTPFDVVDEASEESFPASDPPARTTIAGVGPPVM